MSGIKPDRLEAECVGFDNTDNGFVADNVQDAIEEVSNNLALNRLIWVECLPGDDCIIGAKILVDYQACFLNIPQEC